MKNNKTLTNVFKYTFLALSIFSIAFVAFFSFNIKKKTAFAATTVYIEDAYDLNLFATRVNNNSNSGAYRSANVYLMNNIDMSSYSSFAGIGYHSSYPFTGVFDGQGFSIKNLSVTGVNDRGLFGNSSGTIKNVVIESGTIVCNGSKSAGGIVGCLRGGSVTNCYNLGVDIDISSSTTSSCTTGGIVGYVSAGTISNCYNSGSVFTYGRSSEDSSTVKSGGIAGHLSSGATIRACQNKGTVDAGTKNKKTYAGGIVGYTEGTVSNCLNNGTVKAYAKTQKSSGTINAMSEADYETTTKGGKTVNGIGLRSFDCVYDTGSSYSQSVIEAYRAGIAGAMAGGSITYCIDTATTNYATSGTSYSGWARTTTLNYTLENLVWSGVLTSFSKGCEMRIEMKLELRENYYNRIVGYKSGGSFSNCASNSNPTMKGANIKITTNSYDTYGRVVKENQSWLNAGYDSSLDIYIHTEDLGYDTSPSINLWESGTNYIVYAYDGVGEDMNSKLCKIDMSTNHSGWTSTLSRQSTVSISTITSSYSSYWGLNGSTPELKGLHWKYNTSTPS